MKDEHEEACARIKSGMLDAATFLINAYGVDTFYSGMALGADIWGAETILYLRDKQGMKQLKLIAVRPYPLQSEHWSPENKQRYADIIAKSNDVVTISSIYTESCMQRRNVYMVDHSRYVVAVYNGTPGGTKNTMEYARAKGLTIIKLNAPSVE